MKRGLRTEQIPYDPKIRDLPEYREVVTSVSGTGRGELIIAMVDPLATVFTLHDHQGRLGLITDYGFTKIQNSLPLLQSGSSVAMELLYENAERSAYPTALLIWQMLIDLDRLPNPDLQPKLQRWINSLLVEQTDIPRIG